MTLAAIQPCSTCARERGGGVACQFCGQVDGLPAGVYLSTPGRRLGAYVLEAVLVVAGLVVVWFVWSLIVYARGQTPAKQLLNMRVISLRDGAPARWGRMFVREWIAKTLIGFVAWFTFGLLYLWLVWDGRNQELWDKMVGTVVVTDTAQLLSRGSPPAIGA